MDFHFIFSFLLAISITAILCIRLPKVAFSIGLTDSPGERKQHAGEIPLIGGIAMFVGFSFATLTLDIPLNDMRGLFAGAMILVLVGVLDDLHQLSSSMRFTAQILAAIFMAEWGGARLFDLGAITPSGDVVQLHWWSSLLTIFATVGIINALNMIDGIDGLAGYVSLVAIASMSWLTWQNGDIASLKILFILMATVLTFLFFNRNQNHRAGSQKIFMGDAGSMFLGFLLCWFFINLSQGENASFSPVTALWVFAIPLIDTVAQMLRRLFKGKSPFEADREHIHHILLRSGFSTDATLYILVTIAASLAVVGIFSHIFSVPEVLLFYLFLLLFGIYFYLILRAWKFTKFLQQFTK